MEAEQVEKKSSGLKFNWITALLVVVIVGLAGAGIYFYTRYQHSQALLRDPAAAAREEMDTLLSKVGKHIQLPQGETPTLAKVSDATKLTSQPFFSKAESGDIVLIYTGAGKAILYRPLINKIIEVAPVNLNQEVAGTSTASAQLQTASLSIYNGTNTKGLAGEAEKKIKSQIPVIQISTKTNAKGNYKGSMVVVLNTRAVGLGTQLKDLLNAGITTNLPANEAKPETDLLLIVGEDFRP